MPLMQDLSSARQDDVARLELAQERGVFSVKVGVHRLGTALTQEAVFASKTRVAESLAASSLLKNLVFEAFSFSVLSFR